MISGIYLNRRTVTRISLEEIKILKLMWIYSVERLRNEVALDGVVVMEGEQ